MPCEQRTWTETYWSYCWKWYIPTGYPCRKHRTVTRWCCDFEWIKETRWGFYCTLEGCADGQRYTWGAFCYNVFGTAWFFNIRKCFNRALTPRGSC